MKHFLILILTLSSVCAQPYSRVVDPYRFVNDPCVTCVQNTAANTAHITGGLNVAFNSSALTGLSDSKTVTVSFWVKRTSAAGCVFEMTGASGATRQFRVILDGASRIEVIGRNSANTLILQLNTTAALSSGAWHHIMVVLDMSDTAKRKIYIDGSSTALNVVTYTNDTLDLSPTLPYRVMFNDAGGIQALDGDLSEFWIDDSYNDNVCYFYCNGKPSTLAALGELPNHALPALYHSLSGSGASWFTDSSGNGNAWTVNGTPSSPASP